MLTLLPLAAAGLGPQRAGAAAAPGPEAATLLRLVGEPDAVAVGWAVWPGLGHPTAVDLVQALTARLGTADPGEATRPDSPRSLQAAFQRVVRDDFTQGRCSTVAGWVMARTELELCALAALSAHLA